MFYARTAWSTPVCKLHWPEPYREKGLVYSDLCWTVASGRTGMHVYVVTIPAHKRSSREGVRKNQAPRRPLINAMFSRINENTQPRNTFTHDT